MKALGDSIEIPVRSREGRLMVDAGALLLREDGGVFTGKLLVQFVSYGPAESRKEVTSDPVRVDLSFTRQDHERVLRDGFALPVRMQQDRDAQRLRVVVCDAGSELCGSVTLDLTRRPE